MAHLQKKLPKAAEGSRRKFLKTAAVAAGVLGSPGVMRLQAAAPIKIKIQTAWDAGTVGYTKFHKIPIRSFEDFKDKKIRYPGGSIADIYRAAERDFLPRFM
ncbi:MAG TPA: twin-arginine translocation signal domain-containing protein [Syntrophales bacterium]|nr:twin-arginine translocation signal domain-containing protein [Syntrophales bacterium]